MPTYRVTVEIRARRVLTVNTSPAGLMRALGLFETYTGKAIAEMRGDAPPAPDYPADGTVHVIGHEQEQPTP